MLLMQKIAKRKISNNILEIRKMLLILEKLQMKILFQKVTAQGEAGCEKNKGGFMQLRHLMHR